MSAGPSLAGWLLLAAPDDNIPPGKGPEWGKAAPIGLLIIVLLGVAVVFLVKSMNRNLRKVPASFDPPEAQDDAAARDDDGLGSDEEAGDTPADDPDSANTTESGSDDQGADKDQDLTTGAPGRTAADDR